LEIYTYLRVFIHNIPRKRVPGKYYLEIKEIFTIDNGRNKQVLMEKMDRCKKSLCKAGFKLILDDLECS